MDTENSEINKLRNELKILKERIDIMKLVLDESADPIFNILTDGTYRYVNNAFAAPFNHSADEIIGKKIWDIFSADEAEKRMNAIRKAVDSGEVVVFDVRVPFEKSDLYFITTVKPVRDSSGNITSVICISKNITDRKNDEMQREKLIKELSEAVARINVLSGMLPICAACKKIRNEEGYWTQIEEYISKRSDAEFSHSICPDCANKLYPDFKKG